MTNPPTNPEADFARDIDVPINMNTVNAELRDAIHTYLVARENRDFSVEQILSNIFSLIAAHDVALLDRVEKEVIGDDEDRRGKEDLPGYPVLVDLPGQIKNELRTEQRQHLQQLRQEQMGKEVK